MVMRPGQKHKWYYKHLKTLSKGRWFKIFQLKKRSGLAPKGSGMPVGSKLHWEITATEKVTKLSDGRYKIVMEGTKIQKGYTLNKKARFKR